MKTFPQIFYRILAEKWFKRISEPNLYPMVCLEAEVAKEAYEEYKKLQSPDCICPAHTEEKKEECPLLGMMGQCADGECFHKPPEKEEYYHYDAKSCFCASYPDGDWGIAFHTCKNCKERGKKEEPERWRADRNESYFLIQTINASDPIVETLEDGSPRDRELWEAGNYFPTREAALEKLEEVKTVLRKK